MDEQPQSSKTCCNPWDVRKRSTLIVKSSPLTLVDDKGEFGLKYPNLIGQLVCAHCLKKPSDLSEESHATSSSSEVLPAESSNLLAKPDVVGGQNLQVSSKNEGYSDATEPTSSSKRKKCCNPFQKHSRAVIADLRCLPEYLKNKAVHNKLLIEEYDLVCGNCRKNISALPDVCSQSSEDGSAASQTTLSPGLSPAVIKEDAKALLLKLSGTPLNLMGHRDFEKVNCPIRKFEEIETIVKKKLCLALELPSDKLNSLDEENKKTREEMESIMNEIKRKLPLLNYQDQIQFLTVAPSSLSEREASEYFINVSRHAIRHSRQVRSTSGIFSKPSPFVGRPLETQTKSIVHNFYCNDEISRQMPGIRDAVAIGGGEYAQKRLLLANLRELYEAFKRENPDLKIGFFMFCSLRPKFCIMAGSSGTHNVCVCTTHQNIKLKLHALGLKVKLNELIPDLVCKEASRECMLSICNKCPNVESVIVAITERVHNAFKNVENFDLSEILKHAVQYSSWTIVDRADLLTHNTTIESLISITANDLKKAVPHDFVAGKQTIFLKDLKQSLLDNQAIIIMDFAMNYSCLMQSKATIGARDKSLSIQK